MSVTRKISFLQSNIGPILSSINNNTFHKQQIEDFKKEIEIKLATLDKNKDLRVFDQDNGGVLRGPKKSRKKYEKFTHSGIDLLCNAKYLERGRNNQPSEVPYMRGLFNARSIGPYDIVAYETPLMRKQDNKKTPMISGRTVSCDLLGINKEKKELCCIEVKTVPELRQTFPPYALLEGFAYAVCLDWILKKFPTELANEIQSCCNDFGIKIHAPHMEGWNVTFAIAAPHNDYFAPYIQKKLNNHSTEWFSRRLNEITTLEKIIKTYFVGYFVIDQSLSDLEPKVAVDVARPYFKQPVKLRQTSTQFKLIK